MYLYIPMNGLFLTELFPEVLYLPHIFRIFTYKTLVLFESGEDLLQLMLGTSLLRIRIQFCSFSSKQGLYVQSAFRNVHGFHFGCPCSAQRSECHVVSWEGIVSGLLIFKR